MEEKRIFFIRHGEAEHNVKMHLFERGHKEYQKHYQEGTKIRDPPLTDKGKIQAKNGKMLLKDSKVLNDVDLVFFSPLSRAIQTTKEIFHDTISMEKSKTKFIPHEHLVELNSGVLECDTGISKEELQKKYPFFSFNNLPHEWFFPKHPVSKRIDKFIKILLERKEKVIVVVAHGGVFRKMTFNEYVFGNGQCEEMEFNKEKELFDLKNLKN